MANIVVGGALANRPKNAGGAWVRLSWLLGLKKLGFDPWLLEEIQPESLIDENGLPSSFESSLNLAYFRAVTQRFGLSGRSGLICADGSSFGLSIEEAKDLALETDLLINISGHVSMPEVFQRFRKKVFIDIDPGYTQFWHASGIRGARLEGHDIHFTIGGNISRADCPIPDLGLTWQPTRQPVVLDEFPPVQGDSSRFTTVASWRGGYGSVEFDGKSYGQKAHEFRKFVQLPTRTGFDFDLALDIHPNDRADIELLQAEHWNVLDPWKVAGDPDDFRSWIQRSGAEFTVAQGVYVETQCGWFSDRTIRYLATGKPALIQNTGFGDDLPTDEGIIAFATLDEAVAGAEQIQGDYDRHAAAARKIAEEYFDSQMILSDFLARTGVSL